MSEWLNVRQLAEYLGIGEKMVYRMVGCREIPFHPLHRLIRFKKAEIDEWMVKKGVLAMGSSGVVGKIPRAMNKVESSIDRIVHGVIEKCAAPGPVEGNEGRSGKRAG